MEVNTNTETCTHGTMVIFRECFFFSVGKLLTEFEGQDFPQQNLVHPYETMEELSSKHPNQDNKKEPIPPLPPKTYQCTSELL